MNLISLCIVITSFDRVYTSSTDIVVQDRPTAGSHSIRRPYPYQGRQANFWNGSSSTRVSSMDVCSTSECLTRESSPSILGTTSTSTISHTTSMIQSPTSTTVSGEQASSDLRITISETSVLFTNGAPITYNLSDLSSVGSTSVIGVSQYSSSPQRGTDTRASMQYTNLPLPPSTQSTQHTPAQASQFPSSTYKPSSLSASTGSSSQSWEPTTYAYPSSTPPGIANSSLSLSGLPGSLLDTSSSRSSTDFNAESFSRSLISRTEDQSSSPSVSATLSAIDPSGSGSNTSISSTSLPIFLSSATLASTTPVLATWSSAAASPTASSSTTPSQAFTTSFPVPDFSMAPMSILSPPNSISYTSISSRWLPVPSLLTLTVLPITPDASQPFASGQTAGSGSSISLVSPLTLVTMSTFTVQPIPANADQPVITGSMTRRGSSSLTGSGGQPAAAAIGWPQASSRSPDSTASSRSSSETRRVWSLGGLNTPATPVVTLLGRSATGPLATAGAAL